MISATHLRGERLIGRRQINLKHMAAKCREMMIAAAALLLHHRVPALELQSPLQQMQKLASRYLPSLTS